MAQIAVPLALTAASMAFSAFQGSQQAAAQQSAYDYQVQQAETQANAQRQYQEDLVDDNERQRQENEARAIQHYHFQNLSEDLRLQQIREILAEDTTELRKQGIRARGQMAAAQATRGQVGQSAELVLADIRAQEAAQRVRLERQYEAEQIGSFQRQRGFDIELEQNRAAVQPFIPAPITVNQPIAPNVSPAGGAATGALSAGLASASSFLLPTLQSFQNAQVTTTQPSFGPSFQQTQASFANPGFGGLGSS